MTPSDTHELERMKAIVAALGRQPGGVMTGRDFDSDLLTLTQVVYSLFLSAYNASATTKHQVAVVGLTQKYLNLLVQNVNCIVDIYNKSPRAPQ